MEVEPLNETQLEDLDLNTCNHDIPLSSMAVLSFDEPEPQSKPLANYPSLNISLEDKRGSEPTIKSHIPDSFGMKVVENLTIHKPPSPHVASFHPKDIYCYYHICVDDPKKHYEFKPSLLGQGGSIGVDLSNWEEITNRIACRNVFQENECEFFTVSGDGVRIFPDGVKSPDLCKLKINFA
ncbi:hypothetical protein Tco_1138833 [Tanacetum coccineum]